MNDAIFLVIDLVNRAGALFWPFASLMFVQTLVLVVVLFLVDLALRRRCRAVRYWLWALVLLKLLLPVSLRTPASAAYWLLREPAPVATASTMPPLETPGTPLASSTSSANSFELPRRGRPNRTASRKPPARRSPYISGPCRNRRRAKCQPHRRPRPLSLRCGESSPNSQAPGGCSSPGAAAV